MTPFFMAWTMFLAIPCPVKAWDVSKTDEMLVSLPFIGLLAGGIWFGIYRACCALGLGFLGAAICAVLMWLLTGFMHLDGFLDCADAILSFKDRETRIKILKDTHVGSFSVLCAVILGILVFASWMDIGHGIGGLSLIFIPAAARAVSAFCVLSFEPLKTSAYAKTARKKRPAGKIAACAVICAAAIALGFIVSGKEGFAVLACAAASLITVLLERKNLGGMSGDISGSAITIGETVAVIVLALI